MSTIESLITQAQNERDINLCNEILAELVELEVIDAEQI
jgi:hypothetical protein